MQLGRGFWVTLGDQCLYFVGLGSPNECGPLQFVPSFALLVACLRGRRYKAPMSLSQKLGSPLHIVIIDPWVQTPENLGHDRTAAIAKSLALGGHTVTRLTARGHSATGTERMRMIAKFAPLARRFGHPATATPGFGHGLRLFFALLGQPSPDVVIWRTPPRAGGFAASCFARLSGTPLVIDAAELSRTDPRQNFFARLIDALKLRALTWTARFVLAASPDIKSWYESNGFAPAKVSVQPDGCDTALFLPTRDVSTTVFEKYPQLIRGPLCVYAGSLHRGRRIAEVLEIAAAMQSIAPDVRFAIVGDGPDRLDLNAYAARLDVLEKNLWFVPAVPRAELPAILNAAAIVLAVPSRPVDGALDAASHIFDGLAAGKPIAVLGEGWQRDLIDGRQAGVALPLGNAEAAARDLADFLRDGDVVRRAGKQGLALASGKHNAERIAGDVRQTIEKVAATYSRAAVLRRRALFVKRALDIGIGLAVLVIMSPLVLGIAAGFLAAGWAPFASRLRGGRRGKPFGLYTFDTTKADRELVLSWRTTFAHVLRRSALDRLPELVNVVLGDMSLVGPRPLPAEYTTYYTEAQLRRLDMRPGLTGWAQVNGRQGLTWDDMFTHDAWYVKNFGLGLDLKVLWKTLIGLLLGRGLGALPAGPLPRFDEIEARRQGAEDV